MDPPGRRPLRGAAMKGTDELPLMTWDFLQVRLLGPVAVVADGITRTISGLKRKAVFAALGLHPGETVSTERLTHIVWGTTPPATALNALQTHVSYLRRVLGDAMPIVARSPGYALDISPDA